jgi:hypothetical protein
MDTTSIACPLPTGLHGWIWPGGKGEGWRTARQQAARAIDLGLVGVILQASLDAPAWLVGRDAGETLTRREILRQAGLQVTVGLGLDGHLATRERIVDAILASLRMDGVCVMLDWESETKWENNAGRVLAAAIAADVLTAFPDAYLRTMDAPWWEPEMHSGAPDREWSVVCKHRFVQAYGAPAQGNPVEDSLWMLDHARAHYPARGTPAAYVHPALQMYGHTLVNAGKLVLSGEQVTALWDIEEMDAAFATALHARRIVVAAGFSPTSTGLAAWQAAHGLAADGLLGQATCAVTSASPRRLSVTTPPRSSNA